jgi:signal transduction histidine kinase
MSHELRTPLNAIIGFSEIIRDQMFGAVGHEHYVAYAADINESGARLLATINGVLDMARIEGGRYQLEESDVDLGDIADAAVDAVAAAARQKTLSIERRLGPDLPPLRADARAIRQVLVSLLSNAVKFTEAGGQVSIDGTIDAAGHCLVSVADTGIGIAEQHLASVVQPFHQADSSLARKYEGSGLGLSLAAGLMSLHGGSLAIASRPGAGTTVTLRFPPERLLAA